MERGTREPGGREQTPKEKIVALINEYRSSEIVQQCRVARVRVDELYGQRTAAVQAVPFNQEAYQEAHARWKNFIADKLRPLTAELREYNETMLTRFAEAYNGSLHTISTFPDDLHHKERTPHRFASMDIANSIVPIFRMDLPPLAVTILTQASDSEIFVADLYHNSELYGGNNWSFGELADVVEKVGK